MRSLVNHFGALWQDVLFSEVSMSPRSGASPDMRRAVPDKMTVARMQVHDRTLTATGHIAAHFRTYKFAVPPNSPVIQHL